MLQSRGLLIAFDGVDSSGKETQTKKLVERLRFQGKKVHTFQTPDYNTSSGQELKLRLQGKLGNWRKTSWKEKMKYFSMNRAEHKEEVLAALARGDIVIYDRYVPSSLAFIAIEALPVGEINVDRETIYEAVRVEEYERRGMPREDVSIFLDVPPNVAAGLLEKRKEKLADDDEYTDHLALQERLYNEYDVMIASQPTHFLRVPCVSGTQLLSVFDTAEIIWSGLAARFPDIGTTYAKT